MIFTPIWSDSLGAKSFSFYIEAGESKIIIDPGLAIMQPSYPASREQLIKWYEEAYSKIIEYIKRSNIVIITHYHHDHYLWREDDIEYYRGKKILIKDPNKYINDSQWDRAREFLGSYISIIYEEDFKDYLISPISKEFPDYVEKYKVALSRDFGEYNYRRKELLEKGRKWFLDRVSRWRNDMWIKEPGDIKFADSRSFKYKDLEIKFTEPIYHGIEYSKTGWVLGVVFKYLDRKIIYSSDIQGPTIEDYAYWIIREDPDILFLDGPPTYLIPYMFNLINFRRTIENIKRIIKESNSLKLVIYDHHLTRDIKFKEKIGELYKFSKEYNIELLDVAEYLGLEPAYNLVK